MIGLICETNPFLLVVSFPWIVEWESLLNVAF